MNYDFIGHVETFRDDMAYILWRTGLANTRLPLREVLAEKKNNCPLKPNRTANYMAQLNSLQSEMLFNLYKEDFEMFGYSPHIFSAA